MSIASEKKLSDLKELVDTLVLRIEALEKKTEPPARKTLTAPKKTERQYGL